MLIGNFNVTEIDRDTVEACVQYHKFVEAVDEANMVQVVEFVSQLILGLVINKKYAREVSEVIRLETGPQ